MEQLSTSLYQPRTEPCWCSSHTPKHMPNKFLLIGDNPDSSWSLTVREGLGMLGTTETFLESEAIDQIERDDYSMVIIDAGAVANLTELIVKLRSVSAATPIVVATASPTWQTAKEVLTNGANDYIRKSLDPVKLGATLREILSRSHG